jgi:hypothetical protein
MLTVDESIIIDRPRKEVWDYAVDPTSQTVWQTNVISYDADWDDQPSAENRARAEGKIAGRRLEVVIKVTEAVPGEVFAFESLQAPFDFAFRWSLADADGGTRFDVHAETPGFSGAFGRLTDPLVLRLFSRDVRSNLENLKTVLEEGAGAP